MSLHVYNSNAPCGAQTYWYENGVQRAKWCDQKATMRLRALDGSINRACNEHGAQMAKAGASVVVSEANR